MKSLWKDGFNLNREISQGWSCHAGRNDVSAFWESLKLESAESAPSQNLIPLNIKQRLLSPQRLRIFDLLLYMEKSDVRKYDLFCHMLWRRQLKQWRRAVFGALCLPNGSAPILPGIGGINTFAQEEQILLERVRAGSSVFYSRVDHQHGGRAYRHQI